MEFKPEKVGSLRKIAENVLGCIGDFSIVLQRDWDREHALYLEKQRNELVWSVNALYATVYSQTKSRESAITEVKRFLGEYAEPEVASYSPVAINEIAASILNEGMETVIDPMLLDTFLD